MQLLNKWKGDIEMSLIKNLKRREVEIFGAKRVVRNENKKDEKEKNAEVKKKTKKTAKKKAEVK